MFQTVLVLTVSCSTDQRPCTSGISVTCAVVQQACALPSYSPTMSVRPFIRPLPAPQLRVHIHPENAQYPLVFLFNFKLLIVMHFIPEPLARL